VFQNIDLHALTEWIPERVAIRPGTAEFDADKEFTRLLDRFHKGHCLITVATGELSEAEADRAGLVPTHAYAMLDIREVKVSVPADGGFTLCHVITLGTPHRHICT
jgi:calpain-7